VERIKEEIETICEFFEQYVTQAILKEQLKNMENIPSALTYPREQLMIPFLNLRIQLRNQFDIECLKALLELRQDINQQERKKILDLLATEVEVVKKMSKNKILKSFYKSVMA